MHRPDPATALDGAASTSIGDNRPRVGEANEPRAVLPGGVGARRGSPAQGTVEPLLARHGERAGAYRGRARERRARSPAASREGAGRSGDGAGRRRRLRVAGAIGRVHGRGPAGVAARAVALAFHLQAACCGSPGRAASRGCRARSVRAGATDRPRVRSPRLRLLPLRRSGGSGGLRRVRCGGGVVGVDVGTPRVPGVRRNRCAAVDSVGVAVRLDPLRRGLGRGEGDLARRRARAHAARSGHVGRLRRAVRAGAGRGVATAAHRRAEYDIPRPGPSRSEPARWRNGTASCWRTSRTPRAACSTGSSPTPPWAVRSRRSSPRGSRTDAATPTSPATWWRDVCESCPATRTSASSQPRSARRPRREHRPLGYRRPSAARSRSASMPPRPASPAGKVSRSLIRSPRRVGSSAACRGVWPSSAGMGSSSHLVS